MRAAISSRAFVPLAAAALACAALALRAPGPGSLVVLAAAGLVGSAFVPGERRTTAPSTWIAVTIAGVAAFAAVRWSVGTTLLVVGWFPVAAALMAAVAEEALFRRYLYGWLLRWGPVAAVGVSALAFALVHVPAYGWGAGFLDLGAGVLLGWQRWATGGWTAPAVTHALANLMTMEVLG